MLECLIGPPLLASPYDRTLTSHDDFVRWHENVPPQTDTRQYWVMVEERIKATRLEF